MKELFLLPVVVLAIFLAGCNLSVSQTATVIPPTPPEQRATEIATPAPSKPAATDTPPAPTPAPIIYYYFAANEGKTYPAGSVVILPDVIILAPAQSDTARSTDTAANIGAALQAMIQDPRNGWKSDNLGITRINFDKGTAEVVLRGEIFAAGDVVMIAVRMQILMTVFADAAVQTATVTLNGKNIANLGISHESEAKPAGYAFSRGEIESYMTKSAYKSP